MQPRSRGILWLCLTWAIGLPAYAQTVSLRYQPPAGARAAYDMQMSGEGKVQVVTQAGAQETPLSLAAGMRASEKVLQAGTDGTRLVEMQVLAANATYNGQNVPLNLAGRTMRFRQDVLGRVYGFEGQAPSSTAVGGAAGFDPLSLVNDLSRVVRFPEKPVSVGQSWRLEYQVRTPSGGAPQVSCESILRQVGKANGRPTATVDHKLRVPLSIEQAGIRLVGTLNANMRSTYYTDYGMLATSQWRAAIRLTAYAVGANGATTVLGSCTIPDLRATVRQAD